MLFRYFLSFAFILSLFPAPGSYAIDGSALRLPEPGVMVNVSKAFEPVLIKGLKVHPNDPLLFDFIIDSGHSRLKIDGPDFKAQSDTLIKYFLSALTVPEKDLWVNLSPYEKDRMIAPNLGQTQMGQDMLAQDYLLKQLTASLIYPEKGLGKEFWDKVYAQAQEKYGTSNIPINTFNKVWIVADKADVFEGHESVYVTKAHLKVMMEEDYLATQKHTAASVFSQTILPPHHQSPRGVAQERDEPLVAAAKQSASKPLAATSQITAQIIREMIIPAIEREINEGQNFAPLRQMYYSMILASWYKMRLKDALITQAYGNQSKVGGGIKANDPADREKIFAQYLQAYKKGVFNFIKDTETPDGKNAPRKYFSGGLEIDAAMVIRKTDDELRATGNIALVKGVASPVAGADVMQARHDAADEQEKVQGQVMVVRFGNKPSIRAGLEAMGFPPAVWMDQKEFPEEGVFEQEAVSRVVVPSNNIKRLIIDTDDRFGSIQRAMALKDIVERLYRNHLIPQIEVIVNSGSRQYLIWQRLLVERMKQGTVPANILDRGRERMLQKTALVAMTGLHRIEVVQDLIRRGFKVDVIPLDNINVQEKIEAMVFNRGKKRFGMLNYRLIVSDLSWELKAGNGLYPGWGYKLADFFYKDHGTEDKVFMMIGQGNAVKDLPLAGVDVRGVTAKDLKNQLNNADADIERSLNADWQRFIKSNFKLPRAPKSEELNGQQEKTIAARSPAVSQSVRPEKEGDALAGDQTKKASPSGVRLKILLISPYLNRKTKALRSALGLAQHEVQIGREFDAHQMWDMVIGVATKSVPRNYHGTFMTMRGLAIEDVLDKVATMSQERLISNKAMTVPGGIDLDGGKLLMNVDKDGQGISMRVDPTMLARFRRGDFVGLVFNIVRISPIADLKGILSR